MPNFNYYSYFHFLPVGQGLCFRGFISREGKNWTQIMYDCGAGSVRQFAYAMERNSFMSEKHIKLLVLSHLDDDHVNGLKYLQNNKYKIDNIIIPYMPLSERIKLLKTSNNTAGWYTEFLTNPNLFLSENFGANIYTIVNDSSEFTPANDNDNINFENNEIYFPFENIGENISFYSSLDDDSRIDFKQIADKKQLYQINQLPLIINNFRFYFYNYCYVDLQKLFDEQLHDLFTNQKKLSQKLIKPSEVKKLYKKVSSEHNNHSLCMLIEQADRFRNHSETQFSSGHRTHRPLSIMLTGDYSLNKNDDGSESAHLQDFIQYFRNKLSNVNVLQIPHHGAKSSNSMSAFRCFHEVFGVFSHGIDNKYNHPHYKTWHDLIHAGHKGIYVNEESDFMFHNNSQYER